MHDLHIRTWADGMPSTRIIRRSLFIASSSSPVPLDFVLLDWFSSLLKEWAIEVDIEESNGPGSNGPGGNVLKKASS